MTDTVMTFRVDTDLKKAFERILKEQDFTPSQVLRQHMRSIVAKYMQEHAQGDLLREPLGKVSTKEKKRPSGSVIPPAWRKGAK